MTKTRMKLEEPPDAAHAIARTGAELARKPAGRKRAELIAEFLVREKFPYDLLVPTS